jgi:DNA-binding MurR/RpiR family transcriptional regulator
MTVSRAPGSIERALDAMRARYPEMSASQRLLADFMLERPYQIAFASAAEIGERLGISPATVVRFGDFVGSSGYAGLQKLARESLARQISEVKQFKSRSTAPNGESALHRTFRADIESIERTAHLLTQSAFDTAVRQIAKARVIHVAGFRSNFGLAHQLSFNLSLIGRQPVLLTLGVGDLPEQLLRMRAGDACILISFKRYTARIRDVIEHARASGVSIVAITNPESSFVARFADAVLPVAVKFPSVLESRVAALSVMNALVTAVALVDRKATAASFRRHEAIWARLGTYLDDAAGYPVIKSGGAFEAPAERKSSRRATRRRKGTGQTSESSQPPVD